VSVGKETKTPNPLNKTASHRAMYRRNKPTKAKKIVAKKTTLIISRMKPTMASTARTPSGSVPSMAIAVSACGFPGPTIPLRPS